MPKVPSPSQMLPKSGGRETEQIKLSLKQKRCRKMQFPTLHRLPGAAGHQSAGGTAGHLAGPRDGSNKRTEDRPRGIAAPRSRCHICRSPCFSWIAERGERLTRVSISVIIRVGAGGPPDAPFLPALP